MGGPKQKTSFPVTLSFKPELEHVYNPETDRVWVTPLTYVIGIFILSEFENSISVYKQRHPMDFENNTELATCKNNKICKNRREIIIRK